MLVVWLPMLESDNAAEACSSATMFRDPRVSQFWDPDRLCGLTWSAQFQASQAQSLLDSLPPDHEMRGFVEHWVREPSIHPTWDIAYTFAPGARWGDRVPVPSTWTKQVGYWGPGRDEFVSSTHDANSLDTLRTGYFWTARHPGGAIESDWFRELRSSLDRAFEN